MEYDIFILQPLTKQTKLLSKDKSNEFFSAHFRIAQKPKPIYSRFKGSICCFFFDFSSFSLFDCCLLHFGWTKKNEFDDYDPLSSWLTKRMKHFILIFWPQKCWWARPPFWWFCESSFIVLLWVLYRFFRNYNIQMKKMCVAVKEFQQR